MGNLYLPEHIEIRLNKFIGKKTEENPAKILKPYEAIEEIMNKAGVP